MAGQAQSRQSGERADSIWTVELREVMVTASRTAQDRERIPLPTQILSREHIRSRSSARLADLLQEAASFRIIRNQFGAGIQLRGLDPAYSLVLIDGQPVVARVGGTVDLDRIASGTVERVEIVKGPASSLYGSDALAGVINIITAKHPGSYGQLGFSRETFGTSHLNGMGATRRGGLHGEASISHYASDGYDLLAEQPGRTTPSFTDLSLASRLTYSGFDGLEVSSRSRLSRLRQDLTSGLVGAEEEEVSEEADRDSWETTLEASGRHFGVGMKASLFASSATTRTTFYDPERDASPSGLTLGLGKAEVILDRIVGRSHHATVGAGVAQERASGTRISGTRRSTGSVFVFLQHNYIPEGQFQVTSSIRLDRHSGYGTHWSPRVAGLWRAGSVRLRGSVAAGFKAPTFQQLYLDFTNPGVGYSVVGSAELASTLQQYSQAGQISYLIQGTNQRLKPESAWALDAGVDWDLRRSVRLKLGVFSTHLQDMIETQPVAAKPDGQFVFSYANLNRVTIAGFEAQADVRRGTLVVSPSYQFLSARDGDVVAAIRRGELYGRRDGRDFQLTLDDYGGLFGRSRHSFVLALTRSTAAASGSVRFVYRTRYGLADMDGNLVLDNRAEYAPAYGVVNASVSLNAGPWMVLDLAGYNLANLTHPTKIPSLSGRVVRLGLTIKTTR